MKEVKTNNEMEVIKINNKNKASFAVPYEPENANSELFLPLKAMQEIFRNSFPTGSIVVGEPKLSPEKDGMSYICHVEVYEDTTARQINAPYYSRWVKFNPATDEVNAEIIEDPFNAVSRVAEYKALEAVGCGLNFSKEEYMKRYASKAQPNTVTEEEIVFARSFEEVPSSKSEEANIKSSKKTKTSKNADNASVKPSVESATKDTPDVKVDEIKTSESSDKISSSKTAETPIKVDEPKSTKPVTEVTTEPIAKPAPATEEVAKPAPSVESKSVPEKIKPTEAQVNAAKAVVSKYRNYAGMTMEQIATSAKASKGMTLEEIAKDPNSNVHTGWNMIKWFATSALAAKSFAEESAAAKILIAATE